MMRAYPTLERRHVEPRDAGLERIGHLGFFRPGSHTLWTELIEWFARVSGSTSTPEAGVASAPQHDTSTGRERPHH